jgi:hypothetical protein
LTRFRRSSRACAAAAAIVLSCAGCTGSAPSPSPSAATEQDQGAASAPRRDISGVWAGPPLPTLQEPAPFTPLGQQRYDANKATWGPKAVALGESNDPLITCDPLGFPRSMLYETRGFEFLHTTAKTIQLMQYQRVWREIWTDGRTLPTDAGGDSPSSPDSRWYGYSVGRWEDDNTFVVETTGTHERGWVDYFGRPHSASARFEERYHRVDAASLEATVTITDPETYTRPYVAMKQMFVRADRQELEEQLCVPSEAIEYFNTVAAPASDVPAR